MTPDFFPRISVSLIMASGLCVLVTVPLRKSELPILQLEFNQTKVVLSIIISVIGYVVMIWIIGFFTASIIFLFIFCFTAKYKNPYTIFIAGSERTTWHPELARTTLGTESTPKLSGYANFMTIQALFVCHLLSLRFEFDPHGRPERSTWPATNHSDKCRRFCAKM